ncbi:hypothetical protein AOC36_01665 [Erysipelothrix larvae]|uniref:SipW-cognate class signal peptide n=1 Tax=Erysipelothrix larvae TaxID=1514105 RepID=A0A0X8GYG8_9FIRM|nr:hypothetical protein [Erysipelothrix larvae]AMC92739.1 hypothetical protein AOC36_01665 [Erysipelothrix larvae]
MKDNTKKKSLALFISLCSLFIFAGSLVAYFSDKVTGEASITAGTLDIDGTYELYYNGSEEKVPDNKLLNFNPGDYVVVKASFTNGGTKSAWIRNSIGLTGGLAELTTGEGTPVILVYEGEVTSNFTPQNAKNLTSNSYISGTKVIEGSAEKEPEVNGVEKYEVTYTIYFSPDAGNNAQRKDLELTLQTEALQYRNNKDISGDDAWKKVQEYVADTNVVEP